jgi:hypothetical protein
VEAEEEMSWVEAEGAAALRQFAVAVGEVEGEVVAMRVLAGVVVVVEVVVVLLVLC